MGSDLMVEHFNLLHGRVWKTFACLNNHAATKYLVMSPVKALSRSTYACWMRWQDELEQKHGTAAKAAQIYLKQWRKFARAQASKVGQAVSLANKLRDLMAGKNLGWWRKRSELLEIVATDLEVEVTDLMGGPVARGKTGFPEFPSLEPLTVSEEPCSLSPDGWLLHRAVADLRYGEGRWVVAAPGAGKHLVCSYLRERHGSEFEALTLGTLEVGAEHFGTARALVIAVECRDTITDESAIRRLAERAAPTVVLAPFAPAGAAAATQFGALGRRPPPRTFHHPLLAHWSLAEYLQPRGWRERLAAWVDVRLHRAPDTKYESGALLAWLAQHDPDERLVDTPGALLALAAELHTHGELVPTHEMAPRWVARTLTQPGAGDSLARQWSRRVGPGTYAALAESRLLATASRWGTGPAAEEWAALVPPSVQPGGDDGGAVVVGHLRELRALRGDECGHLSLFPRWASEGSGIVAARRALESTELEQWGRLCLDDGRRRLVDAALDTLPMAALCAVVRGVGKSPVVGEKLAGTAALDATFAAMARRLDAGARPAPGQVEHWQQVADLQARLTLPEGNGGPWQVPATRPDRDEWIANAWTISLSLPPPKRWPAQLRAREFPGWAGTLPTDVFAVSPFPSSTSGEHGPAASGSVARIAALSIDVLRLFRAAPDDIPRLLLPAYIVLAPERSWSITREQIRELGGTWEIEILCEHVEKGPGSLVDALWAVLADSDVDLATTLERVAASHGRLLRLILDVISADAFRATATSATFAGAADAFALVPQRLRATLLDAWAAKAPTFVQARDLLRTATDEDLDVLVAIARRVGGELAPELAAATWRISRERAMEELGRTLHRGEDASSWFIAAPAGETPALAALVPQLAGRPAWLLAWARRRLRDGGDAADVLYGIVRQADGRVGPRAGQTPSARRRSSSRPDR